MEKQKQIKKLLNYREDKDLAVFDELVDIAEKLEPISKSLDGVDTLKGEKGDKGDAPSEEELIKMIKPLIQQPTNGIDGRSPMFVGKEKPKNPQKGDLWYQD